MRELIVRVSCFVADLVLGGFGAQHALGVGRPYQSALSVALGLLALGASVFHLGRPQYAFRAVLGIRTSWMSRECAAFGLFAGSAVAYAAAFWVEPIAAALQLPMPPPALLATVRPVLGMVVAASGVLGVLSSVMLYQVTRRRWWSGARTTSRFALTAALLGLSTTSVSLLISGFFERNFENARAAAASLSPALIAVVLLKLATDLEILVHLRERGLGELKRSALLLIGELRPVFALRVALSLAGIFLALLAAGTASLEPGAVFTLWLLSFGCLLGSELFERSLFFRAASAPKMPGAIGP